MAQDILLLFFCCGHHPYFIYGIYLPLFFGVKPYACPNAHEVTLQDTD